MKDIYYIFVKKTDNLNEEKIPSFRENFSTRNVSFPAGCELRKLHLSKFTTPEIPRKSI